MWRGMFPNTKAAQERAVWREGTRTLIEKQGLNNADSKIEVLYDPFNAALSYGLSIMDHSNVQRCSSRYISIFRSENEG
jgi:hypothetical protein